MFGVPEPSGRWENEVISLLQISTQESERSNGINTLRSEDWTRKEERVPIYGNKEGFRREGVPPVRVVWTF